MTRQEYGRLPDGTAVQVYTLANGHGLEASVITYGGIVVSLKAPDRAGRLEDIVLGHDSLDGYVGNNPYFGAIVGRYGNRIAQGRFSLGGVEYRLARNNGENHLHGGLRGFDKVVWTAREVNGRCLELTYLSKDGEEGYPGNLAVTVTYAVTDDSGLEIGYSATTDRDTVVNLTNHSYFNLAGHGEGNILHHRVMIDADRFTPIDQGLIPTGELRPVEATSFDFREATAIGARIDQDDEQLKFGLGYDHNWVLNVGRGGLALAARVHDPGTGRVLEVHTTEPGVQFYTGNFLDATIAGKGGKVYPRRGGFCLETQHFPDSPNRPEFPSTRLRPGQRYQTTTVYKFRTE